MKILVAEDDSVTRHLLKISLERWQYEVILATDGTQAMEILVGEDAPKLAILDWMMPGTDGVDICRELRKRDGGSYIYTLLLTSKSAKEDLLTGLEAGADDYLVKPFDLLELQARLRSGQRIIVLQENQQRYRLLFSQMLVGFALLEVICDEKGIPVDHRYLELNTAFEKHTGLAPDTVLGRTIREVLPGIEPFWIETYGKVATTGESVHFEAYAEPLQKWFEVTAYRVRPGQTAVTFADITGRKQAEAGLVRYAQDLEVSQAAQEEHAQKLARLVEELAHERDLLHALMDNVSDNIYFKDRESRFVRINAAQAKGFGLSDPGQACGKTDFDFFTSEHAQQAYDDEQKVIRTGGPMAAKEEKETWPDGRVTWVSTIKLPLRDAHGGIIGTFGVSRDVTDRKRAEEALRQSEEKYRSIVLNIPDVVWTLDSQGGIVFVSPNVEELSGYSAEEIRQGGLVFFLTTVHPDDVRAVVDTMQAAFGGQPRRDVEYRGRRKDGRWIWVHARTVGAFEKDGMQYLQGLMADITERRQAQEALRESEERYRLLFERNVAGVFRSTLDGRFLDCNKALANMLGFDSPQEALARRVPDLYYSDEDRAKFLEELKFKGRLTNFEMRLRRIDGNPVWLIANISPLVQVASDSQIIEGTFVDITAHKQAEADLVKYAEDLEFAKAAQDAHAQQLARLVEELAHERDVLGTLMDNLPDFIFYKDCQSRFLRTNPAHAKVLGLSDPRQAVGKTDFDFFPEEDAQGYLRDEKQIIETGQPLVGRIERVRQPDGQYGWCLTSKVPIRDTQGEVTALVGITRDITERIQAEERLKASEERYRELFENASDLVFTADLDLRLTSLNRMAEQTIGYTREEATQVNIRQLVEPKHWERVENAFERLVAGDSNLKLEVEVAAKDGRRVMLEVKPRLIFKNGKPLGIQCIGRDITGWAVAEMELRHAQKMESVGRLASGIAHEINTPIQFVGDNTRFLQDSFQSLQTLFAKYQELRDAAASGNISSDLLPEVRRMEEESDCAYLLEEIPKALTQTLEGVDRVATIVRAMKEFAHPESKEMAAADLNKALLSTLTVARNELKYVANVETDFGDLPLVVCNVGDLNQVFLNLLVNAAHAIGEVVKGTGNKGLIQVRTVAEGDKVLVTIADTGSGIPEGIRAKIFDPFFTTKEVGRGTGQGLAIARSVVVERHKGNLTFDSEVGKGTTFYVRLPIEPGESAKETKVP